MFVPVKAGASSARAIDPPKPCQTGGHDRGAGSNSVSNAGVCTMDMTDIEKLICHDIEVELMDGRGK